jgi:CRISPR-associated exonuclease Cas4
MRAEYRADELLALSGIQHFCFCRRQWALINIERQWQDNVLTAEGSLMHKQADDPFSNETRHGVITSRSLPVANYRIGISGVCDVVEFVLSPLGVKLPNRDGLYRPYPVEYKRGHEKPDERDEVQVCAQALCLEEMLAVKIDKGFLFYGETRHRMEIVLTNALRSHVEELVLEMHKYFERGYTPKVKPTKGCNSCSLVDICLPELIGEGLKASEYIQNQINGA